MTRLASATGPEGSSTRPSRPTSGRGSRALLGSLALLLVATLLTACGSEGSSPTAPDAALASACRGTAPGRITHVVWILMENKASADVLGSPSAPYLAQVARACGVATNDHGVAHPSLPNYIALTSGSTFGISDDKGPQAHPLPGPSIFGQVSDSRRSWKSYEEAMPRPCARENAGKYAVRHNPATYYTALQGACPTQDVPYSDLSVDLASGQLPAFSFLTPDRCHDMHDCGVRRGDRWLAQELPKILGSESYRSASTAVFVAWDEDDDNGDNQIPLYVLAPSVRRGTVVSASFRHQALLSATEQMLGLPALPGADGGSALRSAFHL